MSKELEHGLTEKQRENKKEDKKALRKFALIILLAFGMGLALGAGGTVLRIFLEESSVKEVLLDVFANIAVYGSYVYTTVFLICCIVLYKKSRGEYTAWDGEDEAALCSIETKLSCMVWFSHLMLYGSYFFMAVGIWATNFPDAKNVAEQERNGFLITLLLVLLHIIYALVAGTVIQQKAINLSKEINPEKKGSVYDIKFQNKWLEHCDEAERYTAYKCSFKTFKVMQITGIVLWLVCIMGQMFFNTGVFATIIVTVFLIIMVSVYSVQDIYFAKHPSEVMK